MDLGGDTGQNKYITLLWPSPPSIPRTLVYSHTETFLSLDNSSQPSSRAWQAPFHFCPCELDV